MSETVPIVVDSVKNIPPHPMARCTYFVIQAVEPSQTWILGFRREAIPFVMLGMAGIVLGPPSQYGLYFESPQSYEALFDLVEGQESGLVVDLAEIWIPTLCLGELAQRSDVFRISQEAFINAYKFGRGEFSNGHYYDVMSNRQDIKFSAEETSSMRAWSIDTITEIREQHHLYPELHLKRKSELKDPEPRGYRNG